jgi:ADP-ribosyl-[dinitrogen reductase] hydrolase
LVEPFTNDGALAEMRRAYLDWYGTQQVGEHDPRGPLAREAVLRARRTPEQTCLAALAREEASARCVQERPFAHDSLDPHGPGTIAQPINDSKGCGGVMRVAPIGFLSAEVSDDRLFALAAASAALTHGHPDGHWPAGVMALLVRALLAGESWMQAIARVVAQLQNAAETAGTIRAVSAALSWVGSGAPIGVLGQGRTGDEALSIGLAAALQAQSFEECVALAANHDGASDSTASIAGQLYAAAHGLEVLPEEAVERLDALLPILDVAEGWRAACEE